MANLSFDVFDGNFCLFDENVMKTTVVCINVPKCYMNKLICAFDGNVMKTIVVCINVSKCYINKLI